MACDYNHHNVPSAFDGLAQAPTRRQSDSYSSYPLHMHRIPSHAGRDMQARIAERRKKGKLLATSLLA